MSGWVWEEEKTRQKIGQIKRRNEMTKWNIIIGGCIGISLGWGLFQFICEPSSFSGCAGRMLFFTLGVLLYDWALKRRNK